MLSRQPATFLDWAASPLPSKTQLDAWTKEITSVGTSTVLISNPHSSSSTRDRIEQIRNRIKRHVNVPSSSNSSSDYTVIFTQNATGALKLVGEQMDWTRGVKTFRYSSNCHTSIVGIRASVEAQGGAWECFDALDDKQKEYGGDGGCDDADVSLYAFPAQCNSTGVRVDCSRYIQQIKRISPHSLILVDTASFCSTSIFDLSKHPEIDMIVLSFYKLFGFPTGVGCLIVKTSVLLSHFTSVSSYFGGGSILGLHHGSTGFVKRKGDNLIQRGFSSSNIVSDGEDASPSGLDNQLLYERFEHGTLPFLEILSIDHGFDYIESLHNMNTSYSISSSSPHLTGWVWLEFHVNYLANLCRSKMRSLVHCNGQPVCVLYPDEQSAGTIVATSMGPIINFNLKRADGSFVGYSEVSLLAKLHSIHLRTGCFCNPGACQQYLGISNEEIESNLLLHGHKCGDDKDLINGKPTGSVRISFGFGSRIEDVETWIEFLDFFFRSNERQQQQLSLKSDAALGSALSDHQLELSHIFLYPIKSCGAISVSRWPLDSICSSPSVASNIPNLPANPLPSSRGLLYDRHWMLVDEKGIGLSQKKFPQMCLIQPCIRLDLVPPVMEVRISNDTSYEPLIIAIVEEEEAEAVYHSRIEASVCGDRVKASLINDASISNWFSRFLGIPCRLVRKLTDRPQKPILGSSNADNTLAASLTTVSSFANESSFLLVTIPSINQLCSWQKSEEMPTSSFFSSDFISDAIARFRPNLVAVSASESLTAFEEDSWQGRNIRIASHLFKAMGKCQRCQMICIDQSTGKKSKQPLSTLAAHRKFKGKMYFGHHLSLLDPSSSSSGQSFIEVQKK